MKDPFEAPWHGTVTADGVAPSFTNTLDWRLRERPVELLSRFDDLLRWARTVGAIDPPGARALRAWSLSKPRAAARALAEAREIREAMAAAFQAVVRGESPPPASLRRLEAAGRAASGARALRPSPGGARWVWRDDTPEPNRPAWTAALDAVRILTSPDTPPIRQCADAECGWFFLDTSRNRSRRWCSMESCGNRNKARRFYRRSRPRNVV